MSHADLPEHQLQSLWKALDTDGSGWMAAGEFGRFMRRGEPEKGPTWKEKLHSRNAASRKAVKEDIDRRTGRELTRKLADVQAARLDEVERLSKLLNEKMAIFPDPACREWFKMFAHMDDDQTGRISYKELAGMVREELPNPGPPPRTACARLLVLSARLLVRCERSCCFRPRSCQSTTCSRSGARSTPTAAAGSPLASSAGSCDGGRSRRGRRGRRSYT